MIKKKEIDAKLQEIKDLNAELKAESKKGRKKLNKELEPLRDKLKKLEEENWKELKAEKKRNDEECDRLEKEYKKRFKKMIPSGEFDHVDVYFSKENNIFTISTYVTIEINKKKAPRRKK